MDGQTRLRTAFEEVRALIASAAPLGRAERVPLACALGRVLAEPLIAAGEVPPRATARRAGFAVASADTQGAGPYAPLPLSRAVPVRPGDPLPEGADAVLPEEEAERLGPFVQALAALAPGENAVAAGADVNAGEPLLAAGAVLTLPAAAAAAAAGLSEAVVRARPRVAVALGGVAGAMLRAAAGPALAGDAEQADLLLRPSDGVPRLACRPLEDAALDRDGGRWTLALPATAAAWLGWAALAAPLLARLEGRAPPAPRRARLAAPIASAVGLTDLVLAALEGECARPLASAGQPTCAAVARADGLIAIPPGSEGLGEGAEVRLEPFP